MSNVRISDLPAGTTLTISDLIPVTQSGVTRRFVPTSILSSALYTGDSGTTYRSLNARLGDIVSIKNFGVAGDGSDETSKLQAAVDAAPNGSTIVFPPGDYGTSGLAINKTLYFHGLGYALRTGGTNRARIIGLGAQAYVVKWNNLTTNTANVITGGGAYNIEINGASNTMTDALVVIEGFSLMEFDKVHFGNATGNGLRFRIFWDSTFRRCLFRSINASAAGKAVFYIDSRYNSNDNLNVNNTRFVSGCHFENNSGPYFASQSDSNNDVLQVQQSKFERGTPVAGTYALFDFQQSFRVDISHNHFTNFNAANSYPIILRTSVAPSAAAGTFRFEHNDLTGIDVNTYWLDNGDKARTIFKNNTNFSSSDVTGLMVNIARHQLDFEFPRNLDTSISQYSAGILRNQSHTFISVHKICHNSNRFVTDTGLNNIEKTAYATSAAGERLINVPIETLIDFPGSILLGVRCRSATGAGTVRFVRNASTLSTQTATIGYSTLWIVLTKAQLAGLTGLVIDTGAANAELVYVDGIYILPQRNKSVSTDYGNAGATLTVGSSPNINIWNTVITADRAVALSTTNVSDGEEFHIIRTANATGAFNLNVGTGPLKAMGTAGSYCKVVYNGNTAAWILSEYGVL